MLWGNSSWSGVAFCTEPGDIPYVSVTVEVTNVPLALAVNGPTSVTGDAVIVATNTPITIIINDVTIVITTIVTVSGSNLQVDINDVTVAGDANVSPSGSEVTLTVNHRGAIGWTPVDIDNTTTWGDV